MGEGLHLYFCSLNYYNFYASLALKRKLVPLIALPGVGVRNVNDSL